MSEKIEMFSGMSTWWHPHLVNGVSWWYAAMLKDKILKFSKPFLQELLIIDFCYDLSLIENDENYTASD